MGKWTRRAFMGTGILASGAVIFGIAIRPGDRRDKVASLIGKEGGSILSIWLRIDPDNQMTVIVPHSEMGQGTHTALAMMLADELDADWSQIKVEEAPARKEYANYALAKGFVAGDINFPAFLNGTVDGIFLAITKGINLQATGGSSSVAFTGTTAMRAAGAAAREMLVKATAKSWEVPESEVVASKGMLSHPASGQEATYAEMAPLAAEMTPSSNPKLKSEEAYTIMGTPIKRLDIPAKVDGTAGFGIDVRLPDLKYATIQQPPVFGSTIQSFDKTVAETMPGVIQVLQIGEAVAVVAEGFWQAKQALAQIDITYAPSEQAQLSQADIYDQFGQDMAAAIEAGKEEKDVKKGDAKAAFDGGGQIIEAEYRVPYLAHACMEPMNCTVRIQDGECQVWTGTQNPLGVANEVAELLDLDLKQVHVHNQYLGGGFGRRAENDVVRQAVEIARLVDQPVQLIWTREEDIRQDYYREANVSRFRATLDESGNPVAWENQYVDKHHPPDAPHIPYSVPNQFIHYTKSKTHVPWGNWRSVDHSLHGFFTESFIDELAVAGKQDPYEFRRKLLQDQPRHLKVLEMAAEKGNWGKPLPENWGRGIAIHQSFFTIVAEVVEVEILPEGPKVHHVTCVADPGYAFHPDGFKAQMESGIMYGLSAALHGEITIENGAVKESNFHDYQILRMNEAPKIDTYIINSGNKPGGAGEPSTPAIAPALANAIFNANGQRIRNLPIRLQEAELPEIQAG